MTEKVYQFLVKYGMLVPNFDVLHYADAMRREMERGLITEYSSYPMIPTYLRTGMDIPQGKPVAVIDAGGTNFRRAIARFDDGQCVIENMEKAGMPGISSPATWNEFISFVADAVEELMSLTDTIGFCFSYSANITPEIDGRVNCIDKEVVINGCEGMLVGASLSQELSRRGFPGRKVAVINDTAAVQLGGMAKHLQQGYTTCFGQVSGTGTNTCLPVRGEQIGKLGSKAFDMIVNMESGMYDGLPLGLFDRELDKASHNPGQKRLEKMTAGVYLGELCRRALRQAASDRILSLSCAEKVYALEHVPSFLADAWAAGEALELIAADEDDKAFVSALSVFLFERSASVMCANLTAMAELADAGRNGKAAVFAEGSLVQKNRIYQPKLKELLDRNLRTGLGRDVELVVEEDTTRPGAAAAALMNK